MLLARGQRSIGRAHLRWALVFAPRVLSIVVGRSGLSLDTRFVPAAPDRTRPRAVPEDAPSSREATSGTAA